MILIGLGVLLLGVQVVALVTGGVSSTHVIVGVVMLVGGLVIAAVTRQKQRT